MILIIIMIMILIFIFARGEPQPFWLGWQVCQIARQGAGAWKRPLPAKLPLRVFLRGGFVDMGFCISMAAYIRSMLYLFSHKYVEVCIYPMPTPCWHCAHLAARIKQAHGVFCIKLGFAFGLGRKKHHRSCAAAELLSNRLTSGEHG